MLRFALPCLLLVSACGRSSFTDREVSRCTPACEESAPVPAFIRAGEEIIPTSLVSVGDELVVSGWLRRPATPIPNRAITIANGEVVLDNSAGIVFLARLDASLNGVWRRAYGDAGTDSEVRDTASIGSDVIACGIQNGTVSYQDRNAIADSGYQQPLLAEHDGFGAVRDVRVVPAARSNAQCLDIAANTRLVANAGLFGGDVTPGDTQYTALIDPNSYVVVYDRPAMTPRWSAAYLAASQVTALGIAVADSDDVYASGWFQGENTFGGVQTLSANGTDGFLVRYAADGTGAWAVGLGGAGDDRVADVATLDDDAIVCLRATSELVTVGQLTVATSGIGEAVIARIDANGAAAWARVVAASSGSVCASLTVDASRRIHMGGTATGDVDLGNGTVDGTGARGFVATYSEDGALTQASVLDAGTTITDLAVNDSGHVMALGTFDAVLTVGDATYDAGERRAIFVTRVR